MSAGKLAVKFVMDTVTGAATPLSVKCEGHQILMLLLSIRPDCARAESAGRVSRGGAALPVQSHPLGDAQHPAQQHRQVSQSGVSQCPSEARTLLIFYTLIMQRSFIMSKSILF